MLRTKEILTAAGALACAIGIGFVMQSSEKAQGIYDQSPDARPVLKASEAPELLEVNEIALTSANVADDIKLPTADTVLTVSLRPETLGAPAPAEAQPVPSCVITANATPVGSAMVRVTLVAPCLPNELVTVHQSGMIFTQTTDANGELDITAPALSQDAVFVLAFTNGEGALAETRVPDLADFDRVVLQWKGQSGFQIHAREFGAGYGEEGHVWADAPRDEAFGMTLAGGFLTRHGDESAADPLLAEVYSFPRAARAKGSVMLSVETEITQTNCDLEIEAQSLEVRGENQIIAQDLTLAVPECSSIGDFLVLNNLLQDLKVAGN